MRSRLLLYLLDAFLFWTPEPNTSLTEQRRIELPPVVIECSLTDLAVIHVPVIPNARYYLTSPTNEVVNLDKSSYRPQNEEREVVRREVTNNSARSRTTDFRNQSVTFELFNVNGKEAINNSKDVFKEHLMRMKPDDFMIGPLSEGDHGNWVLSMFYADSQGDVELFQVVSVIIVETIQAWKSRVVLNEGSQFRPRFGYRIRNLETCELISPGSGNRFYGRQDMLDYCGYVVPNVTKDDEGVWTIVAVGSIVYKATVDLVVLNKSL